MDQGQQRKQCLNRIGLSLPARMTRDTFDERQEVELYRRRQRRAWISTGFRAEALEPEGFHGDPGSVINCYQL